MAKDIRRWRKEGKDYNGGGGVKIEDSDENNMTCGTSFIFTLYYSLGEKDNFFLQQVSTGIGRNCKKELMIYIPSRKTQITQILVIHMIKIEGETGDNDAY